DEVPFWLNGYVNKQKNYRIWSEANPQVSCGSNTTAQHVTQLVPQSTMERLMPGDRLISRFGPREWLQRS
ncbi:hypothetical protein TNCV_1338301, partial [Trichonephila clavipes]